MAFPQAPVERDLYMEIPKGVKIEDTENTRDYVLRIIKNLYGQKQAGRVWYQYLVKGLQEMGFIKSKVDKCVFLLQELFSFNLCRRFYNHGTCQDASSRNYKSNLRKI